MVTIVLLLGALPAAAVERAFALNANGVADFITDGAGNIVGANVTASGNATHLGLVSGVGTLHFAPDPDNPTKLVSLEGSLKEKRFGTLPATFWGWGAWSCSRCTRSAKKSKRR